jgi:hypothetical protein
VAGNSDSPGAVAPSAMAARLQTVANIAVILASLAVLWMAWERSQPAGPEPPPTYAVGDQMDAVDGVDFRGSERTLILALREDCRFCRDSMPFYQKLTTAAGAATGRAFRLTVLSTDSQAALSAYLRANGVEVDDVVSYQSGALKIPGTPLLILLDRGGVVQRVWRGRPRSRRIPD